MLYVKLKGYKERNDLARYYRRVRAEHGHSRARAIWRMQTAFADRFERAVADDIMNARNSTGLFEGIFGGAG